VCFTFALLPLLSYLLVHFVIPDDTQAAVVSA
jgi:hypothetical protein